MIGGSEEARADGQEATGRGGAMATTLLEPQHPSGRELTELERSLFCLYLVAVEAKNCSAVFMGHEDRKHDGFLVFTVINHAVIIVHKFLEAWQPFNGLARSDERVRKLCGAVNPAIDRLDEWPQLRTYRNQALAHPYRDTQGRVLHPTAFILAGTAPLASDETMQLVLLVIIAVTAALAFFETEFNGIRPLLEDYGPEPVGERPMSAQERTTELQALIIRMNKALEALGIDLKRPIFRTFSLD